MGEAISGGHNFLALEMGRGGGGVGGHLRFDSVDPSQEKSTRSFYYLFMSHNVNS